MVVRKAEFSLDPPLFIAIAWSHYFSSALGLTRLIFQCIICLIFLSSIQLVLKASKMPSTRLLINWIVMIKIVYFFRFSPRRK